MNEHAKMPTFNLAEAIHNKWFQQFENKIYVYEAEVDNSICVFMHISNYISWLRVASIGKGHDFALRLKVASRCGGSKLSTITIKTYLGEGGLNTSDCAL